MNSSTVLAAFGELLGVDLSLDENGQCLLQLDGELLVSIREVNGHLSLYGMLGEFPDKDESDFWKSVLAMNCQLAEVRAGFIAVEPSTDALLLIHPLPKDDRSVADLKSHVERFVSTQERIIEFFSLDGQGSECLADHEPV